MDIQMEQLAKEQVLSFKDKKLIALSVGNHGLIFCQVLNKGNFFKKSFDTYIQVLDYLSKIF